MLSQGRERVLGDSNIIFHNGNFGCEQERIILTLTTGHTNFKTGYGDRDGQINNQDIRNNFLKNTLKQRKYLMNL